jgi:DNA-binding LacI/PurR family transcriptional regulator
MSQRRPTSFDIAELAGVSQPTVSRALSGNPSVSAETRARVLAAAAQLQYKVDKNASGLRRQHSRTLALLFFEDMTPEDSLINPFYLSMLGSMVRSCAGRSYDLLISFQQLSSDWHVDYEDSRKADGIILLGYGDYLQYRPRLEKLIEQETHFVRWGSPREGQIGTTIGSDNEGGGFTATEHLLGLGRRRIAFLGSASPAYPEILAAIGAMRVLQEAGRSVPHDVAIVGFDDLTAARLARPALSTVAQGARLAGEALVEALIDAIERGASTSRLLPVELKVRGSSVSI